MLQRCVQLTVQRKRTWGVGRRAPSTSINLEAWQLPPCDRSQWQADAQTDVAGGSGLFQRHQSAVLADQAADMGDDHVQVRGACRHIAGSDQSLGSCIR